jgi:HAD superfamily hydrolase (TIGR01662 family)
MCEVVLFDFDNTIANTESIRDIRESGDYDGLNDVTLSAVKMYGPVPDLLAHLKNRGIKVGLVTNSGAGYIRKLLTHLKLEGVFNEIVTYSDVLAAGKKPSPKGLELALEKLGVDANPDVLYIGDEHTDIEAAYRAGITPVIPSWASRKPVAMAPAIEMSSTILKDFIGGGYEFGLFAELAAKNGSIDFPRKNAYFLPLDASANVVTVRDDMRSFCLGRYFSQKGSTTAKIHDRHDLSKEIVRKDQVEQYVAPQYWVDALAHVIRHGSGFMFSPGESFDFVTVIPAKSQRHPRLEEMLTRISSLFNDDDNAPVFLTDLLYFTEDAVSQKTLLRYERAKEVERTLCFNGQYRADVSGKRILVIDDVITTGSTLARAMTLLDDAGAENVVGLSLAKTVSILEEEKSCLACGRPMQVMKNKKQDERFWGCTGYFSAEDKCEHTEQWELKECPRCSRPMKVRKNGKTGEKFWGCLGFNLDPACNHTEHYEH